MTTHRRGLDVWPERIEKRKAELAKLPRRPPDGVLTDANGGNRERQWRGTRPSP